MKAAMVVRTTGTWSRWRPWSRSATGVAATVTTPAATPKVALARMPHALHSPSLDRCRMPRTSTRSPRATNGSTAANNRNGSSTTRRRAKVRSGSPATSASPATRAPHAMCAHTASRGVDTTASTNSSRPATLVWGRSECSGLGPRRVSGWRTVQLVVCRRRPAPGQPEDAAAHRKGDDDTRAAGQRRAEPVVVDALHAVVGQGASREVVLLGGVAEPPVLGHPPEAVGLAGGDLAHPCREQQRDDQTGDPEPRPLAGVSLAVATGVAAGERHRAASALGARPPRAAAGEATPATRSGLEIGRAHV